MMNAEQLVSELAEAAIGEVAPGQAELLEIVGSAYRADPSGFLDRRSERDEALGIGVGEAAALFAVAAFYVADVVVQHLLGKAADAGGERVARWWHRRKPARAQGPVPAGALPVDAATAERFRAAAHEKALQFGLDDASARLLADAIVGAAQRRET